jgi:chromosomal replication initiation ATPase DnaA
MMAESPSKSGSAAFRGQLALDLELPPHFGRDDFLTAPANATALHMIDAWPQWPDHMLLLLGPTGAGKSHLAAIWAARANAEILPARTLAEVDLFALAEKAALVLEDAEQIGAAEAPLFHLINLMRERKASLLLTAQQRPALWGLATADLLSRLRLAPVVELGPPDDALLEAGLVKLFNDRQLSVDAAVVDYIALHIDRSFDTARQIVALLDREALARGGKVTRAMARGLLKRLRIDDEE